MNIKNLLSKLFICSLFRLHTAFIYSLTVPDFSLVVTAVESSCAQNGELQFSVSGTDPNAEVTYTITRISDNVVLALNISDNTFGGLLPGDYEVVATQMLNAESNFESEIITVLGTYEQLDFDVEITNENCANGGEIEIVINAGIFKSAEVISGPTNHPIQGSLVFSDLTQGEYLLHILDECDVLYVITTTVGYNNSEFIYYGPYASYVGDLDCNETRINQRIQLVDPNGASAFPLTITYTISPPAALSLPDTVVSYNVTSYNTVAFIIPYYGHGNSYLIDIELVDNCGNSFLREDIVWNQHLNIFAYPGVSSCGMKFDLYIGHYKNPVYINFISAPEGFDPLDFNINHPGPFYLNGQKLPYENNDIGAPEGEYIIEVVDSCSTKQKTFTLVSREFDCWFSLSGTSCEEGLGNSRLNFLDPLESATLLSAPIEYGPTPQDASSMIWPDFANSIWLTSAPPGVYTFEGVDSCGNVATCTQEIEGLVDTSFTYEVIPACSKFDLYIDHKTNFYQQDHYMGSTSQFYFLQRYDTLNMVWKYADGNNYVPGGFPHGVPELENKAINFNYFDEGYYRVLKIARFPTSSFTRAWVHKVMAEFAFLDSGLDFSALYSFQCDNDTYSVISKATGVMPLKYRITDKDGESYTIDNGDNPVFEGLDDGLYTFEVEDPCGNIKIRELEIAKTSPPSIQTFNLCHGQEGKLFIDNLDFLDFQWWHNDDPSTILSVTNELEFSPFDNISDAGSYSVNISYSGAAACIDTVLTIFIPAGETLPYAGNDVDSSICPDFGELNLNDLLDPAADRTGIWLDKSDARNLENGVIYSDDHSDGTYIFEYQVTGFCEGADTSLVTLTIGDVNPPICTSQNISISLDEFGQATITENDIDAGSADECGGITLSLDQYLFSCDEIGANQVTLTVADVNGNSSTCEATITVIDAIDPLINCPTDISTAATGPSGAVVSYETPIGSDNCSGANTSMTAGLASGSSFPIGETVVTYQITDLNDGIDECSFTVTITGLAPEIECPENITKDNTIGECGTAVSFAATETYGIPASTITYSHQPEDVFPVGTTTVTATATNAVGSSSCSFDVVVTDDEAPVIAECPSNISLGNDAGVCEAEVSWTEPTGTDNCTNAIDLVWTKSHQPGDTFQEGTTTVTYTVTDMAGKTSLTCSFDITVTNTLPSNTEGILAQLGPIQADSTFYLSADFNDDNIISATWSFSSDGDFTNGDTAEYIFSGTFSEGIVSDSFNFDASQTGVYTLKVEVTDACGETDEAIYNYVVVYDPSGGFVTGGGWFHSPLGALVGSDATGKANFGLVAKYKTGKNNVLELDGNTNFQFKEGNFHFKSNVYDEMSLVISGFKKATYRGIGTVNGSGSHKFMVTVIDGDAQGGDGNDKFRIKIWASGSSSEVIYDNEIDVPENAESSTVLGGGSIVIHKPTGNNNFKPTAPIKDKLLTSLELAAWPNPSDGAFNLNFKSLNASDEIDIQVYDLNGKIIYRQPGVANQTYSFGASFQPGIYFVNLVQGDESRQVKLVKY